MKYYFSFILFLVIFQDTQGQITFHKLIPFEFRSTRFSAIYPTDSCYFVSADVVLPSNKRGVLFVKLDLNGEILSTDTIVHPARSYGNLYGDLISVEDSLFVKTGIVGDTITKAFLFKYKPNGDTILTREYLSIVYPDWYYLVPRQVREKPDKGLAVLIVHESALNVDFDISLLILDSIYNIVDYRIYGIPSRQEKASSLIIDNDGGYIIGADRNNANQTSMNFSWQTYIIKTDSLGEIIWEYLSPSWKLQHDAAAILKTPDGGLVVASGQGSEKKINSTTSMVEWDALVFKLDQNQNVEWSTPFRGARPWSLSGIIEMVEAPDGSGYVCLGKVADPVSSDEPKPGSWLFKVSPEGDSLWARYYTFLDDTFIDPIPYDLKATSDGGYIAVGNTIRLGQPSPAWILKVDEFGCVVPGCHLVGSTEGTEKVLPELAIYPNPASETLNFQLRNAVLSGSEAFRIVDVAGKVIYPITNIEHTGTYTLPVWDWSGGIYFLQLLKDGVVVASERLMVGR